MICTMEDTGYVLYKDNQLQFGVRLIEFIFIFKIKYVFLCVLCG